MVVATQPDIPYTHTHTRKQAEDKKLQSVAAIILWQLQIVE